MLIPIKAPEGSQFAETFAKVFPTMINSEDQETFSMWMEEWKDSAVYVGLSLDIEIGPDIMELLSSEGDFAEKMQKLGPQAGMVMMFPDGSVVGIVDGIFVVAGTVEMLTKPWWELARAEGLEQVKQYQEASGGN